MIHCSKKGRGTGKTSGDAVVATNPRVKTSFNIQGDAIAVRFRYVFENVIDRK